MPVLADAGTGDPERGVGTARGATRPAERGSGMVGTPARAARPRGAAGRTGGRLSPVRSSTVRMGGPSRLERAGTPAARPPRPAGTPPGAGKGAVYSDRDLSSPNGVDRVSNLCG